MGRGADTHAVAAGRRRLVTADGIRYWRGVHAPPHSLVLTLAEEDAHDPDRTVRPHRTRQHPRVFGAAGRSMRQERADEVLATLVRHGVNHIDTAAGYGDSELRIGPWMREHRQDVFLATKTGERTGDAARAELERSLERLQVDHVDLVQLHNLVEPDEWETRTHPAASRRWRKARDEGLTRFVGVTGHGTRIARMHLRSLERFPFDSVLFPYSYVALTDDAYRADVEELLACARPTRWRSRPSRACPPPLAGRPRRAPLRLVRAADGRRRDRPGGAVGARQPAGLPRHVQRRQGHGLHPRRRRGRPHPAVTPRCRPTSTPSAWNRCSTEVIERI